MNDDKEYLISFANLKANLFKYQKNFLNKKNLYKFYKHKYYGVPLCLPFGIKYFDYSKAILFKINKKQFANHIFNTNNLNYVGVLKYFRYGDIFATNVKLKKKYEKKLDYYLNHVNELKEKIKKIKSTNKLICAMQIRNVPHYGHEAIFKYLLSKYDILVLNPIFGIKKKNDFSDKLISFSLKHMEKKYKNLYFLPIFSNFHYAGPREAIHHINLREKLGFKIFYIGRDHAGAENLYSNDAATKLVNFHKSKFKMNICTTKGGFFCAKCHAYLIKGSCAHKKLLNISGTDFRYALNRKKEFKHADIILQKKIIEFI